MRVLPFISKLTWSRPRGQYSYFTLTFCNLVLPSLLPFWPGLQTVGMARNWQFPSKQTDRHLAQVLWLECFNDAIHALPILHESHILETGGRLPPSNFGERVSTAALRANQHVNGEERPGTRAQPILTHYVISDDDASPPGREPDMHDCTWRRNSRQTDSVLLPKEVPDFDLRAIHP